MAVKHGQRVISPEAAQALGLGDVNHLYGNTATFLQKPAGATMLFWHVESGAFRVKAGDYHTTLVTTAPSASVTDGSGSRKLATDDKGVFPAPGDTTGAAATADGFTFVGSGATDILTYYWM